MPNNLSAYYPLPIGCSVAGYCSFSHKPTNGKRISVMIYPILIKISKFIMVILMLPYHNKI